MVWFAMLKSWITLISLSAWAAVRPAVAVSGPDLGAIREDPRFLGAITLATDGDYAQAEREFRFLLEANPDHPGKWWRYCT